MKRDFTIANYNKMTALFRDLKADGFDQTAEDALHAVSRLDMDAAPELMDIKASFISLCEKIFSTSGLKRMVFQKTTQIFEGISTLDDQFHGDVTGFGLSYTALLDFQNSMKALIEANEQGSKAVAEGKRLTDYFNSSSIREIMSVPNAKLKKRQEALENGADYTSENYRGIPECVKQQRIQEFEKEHPEYTEQFEKVLSDPDITDQQKTDIKYIAYCAPEPYRSIYLEHLSRYRIDVDEDTKGAYFMSDSDWIYIHDDSNRFEDNARGPYNTVFHESGHAVDDFELELNSEPDEAEDRYLKTRLYRYKGERLNKYINEDVRNYVNQFIDSDPTLNKLTPVQRAKLLRSMNLSDDASFEHGGSKPVSDNRSEKQALRSAQNYLEEKMYQELKGEKNGSTSDVFGGVTNNAIIGDYGHRGSIWKWKKFDYWYEGDKQTGKQESELWAGFFAAKMTHDEKELESIRKHFPQAYEAMEEMAKEMNG